MPIASKTKKHERPPLMVLYISDAGVGKTTAAMTFPDPLILDGESGTRHYLSTFNGAVIHTKQYKTAMDIIRQYKNTGICKWKENGEELEFKPKSIVIDPATAFWTTIQIAKMQKSLNSQGISVEDGIEAAKSDSETISAWQAINMHWANLIAEFKSSGLNFIATAHEKEQSSYNKNERGKLEISKTGKMIADMNKKYRFDFDLVLRLISENGSRHAVVEKTRLKNNDGSDRFIEGQRLDRWDFEFLSNGLSENVKVTDVQTDSEAAEGDRDVISKDPAVLKIASEIRSSLLPKRAISNEDLEAYLKTKLDVSGERIALEGSDGKVHLSEMRLKSILWLQSVLTDDVKAMQLIGKIKEIKK